MESLIQECHQLKSMGGDVSFFNKIGGLGKRVVKAPVTQARKLLAVDEARENYNWISKLAKSLMPGSVKVGRIETFDRAMERQSVTTEDLEKIYTNHVLRFWISFIMLATGLAIAVKFAIEGQFLVLLPSLGFSAICLSQMFSGSFRAYQIAMRRFCDVSDWVANRSVWIPTTFDLPSPVKKPSGRKSAVVSIKKDEK